MLGFFFATFHDSIETKLSPSLFLISNSNQSLLANTTSDNYSKWRSIPVAVPAPEGLTNLILPGRHGGHDMLITRTIINHREEMVGETTTDKDGGGEEEVDCWVEGALHILLLNYDVFIMFTWFFVV